MTRHLNGPVLTDRHPGAGVFKDIPIEALNTEDWVVYVNDFLTTADYDATNDFTLTQVTGGSADFLGNSRIGVLRLDAPAQNQGPIIQLDGPTLGNILYTPQAAAVATNVPSEAIFRARFSLRSADSSDVFVGLAELDSNSAVLTAAGALTSDTHAGFHLLNADNGSLRVSVAGDDDTAAVTTEGVFTLSDSEWVDVAVRVVGSGDTGNGYAEFAYRPSGRLGNSLDPHPWVNLGSLNPAAAWDVSMFPTIALIGDAAGNDLDLDKIVFATKRDTTITT